MSDVDRPLAADPRQLQALYTRALEELPQLRDRLTVSMFEEAIGRSLAHRFADGSPDAPTTAAYVDTLRAPDLALASACAAGDDEAWDHLVATYRPILYRAARALAGDEATARELADTLWAELYGVGRTRASTEPGVARRSLLFQFHGRSTLATWLRAVLAQRHVDLVRERRRVTSLDDGSDDPASEQARPAVADLAPPPDPDRARYVTLFLRALDRALADLAPRDRLRLGCYYTQGLTLVETGRGLGESEATVSRKLARTRRHLRTQVERQLTQDDGLQPAEVSLCYRYAVDAGVRMQEFGAEAFQA